MIDSFHLKTPPLSGVKGFVVERFITLLCRTGPFLQWTQWHRMPKIYVFELNGYNLPMFAYYVSWRVKLNLSCFISETIFRGRLKSEIKSLTKTTNLVLRRKQPADFTNHINEKPFFGPKKLFMQGGLGGVGHHFMNFSQNICFFLLRMAFLSTSKILCYFKFKKKNL